MNAVTVVTRRTRAARKPPKDSSQFSEALWLGPLGSGLIDQSQKATAAAMQIAEK
jgi:hypothetical protein